MTGQTSFHQKAATTTQRYLAKQPLIEKEMAIGCRHFSLKSAAPFWDMLVEMTVACALMFGQA